MEKFLSGLGWMSIQAGIVVIVVLVVRFLFEKLRVPKKWVMLLWMIPYLCMICPWKIESDFGFWRQYSENTGLGEVIVWSEESGSRNAVSSFEDSVGNAENTQITDVQGHYDSTQQNKPDDPIENVQYSNSTEQASQTGITGSDVAGVANSVNSVASIGTAQAETITRLIFGIWLVGVLGIAAYSIISYVLLKRKLLCSVNLRENIYIADDIQVPFVLGILRPRIYLPSGMSKENQLYVLAHENTHIRRKDTFWKLVALLITAVHWFNPLAWVALHFMEKDMEMACDEETVRRLGLEQKQAYATALLQLSAGRSFALGAPLAFGEGNVKGRIQNIVKYKKTVGVVSVLAVVLVAGLAVVFMSSANTCELQNVEEEWSVFHATGERVSVVMDGERTELPAVYCEEFSTFFLELEVVKQPMSKSRSEDRTKEIAIGFDEERFYYLSADCTEIWSDNRVKPGYSYEILKPQEVRDFLERMLGSVAEAVPEPNNDTAEGTTAIPENTKAPVVAEQNELQQPEYAEPPVASLPAFTMEEMIALCKEDKVGETMRNYVEQDGFVPENFEKHLTEGSLTWRYLCHLDYEGKSYTLRVYYWNPETAQDYGHAPNQLDTVILYEDSAGDALMLYSMDSGNATVPLMDIEDFLDKEYDIEQYLTFTLPEGTFLGDYSMSMNDMFQGSLIQGDFEEIEHGEWAPEAWYAPGGVGLTVNDDRAIFEDGKLQRFQWLGNHLGGEMVETLENCDLPAVLYHFNFDIFTLPELEEYANAHNVSMDEVKSVSDYWYVFFAEPEGEYVYTVFLNQAYFDKEDIVKLAESVRFVE